MKVLVDTSVWSLALRRRKRAEVDPNTSELIKLIGEGQVMFLGAIRQEILSGIKEPGTFERLREHLRAFPDIAVTSDDHEEAASAFNRCKAKGIQGSNTDFLICAVAIRRDLSIFTTDRDFTHFAKALPITLHAVRR